MSPARQNRSSAKNSLKCRAKSSINTNPEVNFELYHAQVEDITARSSDRTLDCC